MLLIDAVMREYLNTAILYNEVITTGILNKTLKFARALSLERIEGIDEQLIYQDCRLTRADWLHDSRRALKSHRENCFLYFL